MNTIRARMHQTRHASGPHPMLFVDDIPLDKWVGQIGLSLGKPTTAEGLVPAQGWLDDKQDLETAWLLLEPHDEPAAKIVPILVCPDDVDLDCTVVVVEQATGEQCIRWARIGLGDEHKRGTFLSARWLENGRSAEFDRNEFAKAVAELGRLTSEVWEHR